MSIEVTMPRLSDTMESGTIVEWKVAVGDKVSSGDVVADVETDKATMELAVYDDGTIASIDHDFGHLFGYLLLPHRVAHSHLPPAKFVFLQHAQ